MKVSESDLITEGFVLQFSRNDELKSIQPSFRNLRRAQEDEVKYENPVLYNDGTEYNYNFSRSASGRVCVSLEEA